MMEYGVAAIKLHRHIMPDAHHGRFRHAAIDGKTDETVLVLTDFDSAESKAEMPLIVDREVG